MVEKFEKIKTSWKNSKKQIPYNNLTKKGLFELCYHAVNDVPNRCIKIITKPGDDDIGNFAIIYLIIEKSFITIETALEYTELTIYSGGEQPDFSILDKNEKKILDLITKFKTRSDDIQQQILKSILIERKIDEVIDLVNNKEITRKVYFAIGEARERASEVPIIKNAPKSDIVLLSIMKWMNIVVSLPQEDLFPESKIQGLVKNFLEIKKWLIDFINSAFSKDEKELLTPPQIFEEEEE